MSSPVCGQRSAVFNTADLEVLTNKSTDGCVTTLTIVFTTSTAVSSYLDVEGSDATSTDDLRETLCGLHSSICRRLVLAAFNHHTTANTTNSFSTR